MSPARRLQPLWLALLAAGLAGCAGTKPHPPEEPTLASLSTREAPRDLDTVLHVTPEQTMAAYRRFIDVAVGVPQRAEALRRLGDLEMDSADRRAAASDSGVPDYTAARARYEDFLKNYPKAPQRDRVLYQLARAQEQAGELEAALLTLNTLVQQHPGTRHASEAQFRRGELLFAMRDYKAAEGAYAAVIAYAPNVETSASPLVERALYMQGWSFYKHGLLDEALQAFFRVLDLKLAALPPIPREEADLSAITQLTRADRELLDDSFRVISISLFNLQGAASVPRYIEGPVVPNSSVALLRSSYQFRVYRNLAELFLKQDRVKDAADTLAAFVRLQPLHAQAPLMLVRVAQIYGERGYPQQALQARRELVRRYGAGEEGQAYARAQPSPWRAAQTQVQADLAELARHHHAQSQQTHAAADVDASIDWYRALLTQFPQAEGAAQSRYLLAELLFENRRWAEAATEYEAVAYDAAPPQPEAAKRKADAGYAALLAYAEQEKAAADAVQRSALQQQAVDSALRYAQAQAQDPRSAAVLVRAAEQLQALGEGERAAAVAQQALALRPAAATPQRRAAWVVIAQQAYETSLMAEAEAAYTQVLALTPAGTAAQPEVAEKLATTMYRQGEQARAQGEVRVAVAHFERIAALAALPAASALRATAQYDAAAALITLQDWPATARTLEDFRSQHPAHELQGQVPPKLALVYEALQQPGAAAAEFERVAAASTQTPELARSALWRAAELHGQAAENTAARSPLRTAAIKAYERVLAQPALPLEASVEALWRLAVLFKADGQGSRALQALRDLQQADAGAGAARTPRTRTLGGQAALALAEPVAAAYRAVPLVEPLARQLKLKKARFEEALRACAAAAEVGITEVATAATFQTAALYQDFGQSLTTSARPKKLNKAELEQYNVMLEEQAYPFEEQAISLHELNARRAAAGVYDEAVRKSYAELARLKPARWGKTERTDGNVLNQQGIAQRQQGRFDEAQRSYEAAIAQDDKAAAPQLNLAILHDLYLGDAARATALYQSALALSPGDATVINKWLAELKTRKPEHGAATAAVAAPKEPS